jgi:hypothetical protein
LSFFDEDEEPVRTTARTRAQPKPRPRSGRPAGGRSADAQNVAVRRMVAGIVGLLILILLFVVVRACNDRRHENAMKDYNLQVGGIATQSRQTGEELFKALAAAGDQSPQDLYTQINSLKGTAEKSLEQAQALDVPGDMADAQQSLLIALMLRRDALGKVAGDIRAALGDAGEASDRAIKAIAGQNQAFNASDVLYNARVVPFIKNAFKKENKAVPEVAGSTFMNEISWVSAPFVASNLGQQLSTDAGGNGGKTDNNQTTGPGLHGTGLNGTSYGNTTLSPTAANQLVYAAGQAFTVSFTNQGDNDEFNIKVTLKIARTSGGSPLTLTKTVPRATKGEKVTVTLPLNRKPPLGTTLNITVNVAAVPGEKKTDNNKSSYPSLFSQG